MVFMITTMYFWKISKDWAPYFCIVFVFNIIALIGSLYLPESPRMLLELGKEDEAIEILERIASFNGKKLKLANSSVNMSSAILETTVDRS